MFVPNFSEWIAACAPDELQRATAAAMGATSLICVPLVTKGQPAGMASFATTRSGRRYNEHDLLLLNEVAGRLSIAIENHRLIQDLRAANAAKDEFLGLVSHELRTPLTTIQGNAAVLRDRAGRLDEDSVRSAIDDIAADGQRLHSIIENLLLLARLEQGQLLEREPVIVVDVARRVVARHLSRNRDRRIKVLEKQRRRRPVNFAEGYLEQVLENLLSNAEKSTARLMKRSNRDRTHGR